MSPKLLSVFRSRKFYASLIGLAFLFVQAYAPSFPLGEDQIAQVVYLIVAYVLGTALEDGLSNRAASARAKG